MPRLLITGVTGLIGKSVLNSILKEQLDYEITALIRPNTALERFSSFRSSVELAQIDLADTERLYDYLKKNSFDVIMHIGALRGGRKFPRDIYIKANYYSTEQFVEHCQKHGSRFIYCSSVGVFGVIPKELPATNETERNPDSLYHWTKIESERIINQAVLKGLNAAILRPSITYGPGDYGFPYQMVKLVQKKLFPIINKRIWIHLCNVNTITRAFLWLLKNEYTPGLALNVADREPVQLRNLVDFISREIHGKNYNTILKLDRNLFALGESIARKLKNELWTSRFQLISHSWFYYVDNTYDLMNLPPTFTIPDIRIIIDDILKK